MSNSLGATIDQVQVAFDNGDYRSVVESCTHIINQYPHYTAAQRLLGQAYLEQGQAGEAEAWFARLLVHDPRDPSAYLGLGLIAEDRGVLDHALAYCQVAWELAPFDSNFRAPVNRVAEKRYGVDGRLRLTHAALARIHANASRLRRAIKEYQSALIALPDRIDLWMGLAETLWALGENADAAEIAREFLKDHNDLIPALVILADIEHRTGDAKLAAEYRDRLRRLDPDGTLTAAMIIRQSGADTDFMLVKAEEQPEFEDWSDTVVSERPQFAPAPDFSYMPERDQVASDAEFDDLQPIRLEEFGDEMPEIPAQPTSSSFIPQDLEEEEEPDTVEVEQLGHEQVDELIDEAPQTAQSDQDTGISSINLLEMELDDETPPFSDEPVDEAELESLLNEFEGIEPMSLDDFGASDGELLPQSSGFFEDSEIDFDIRIEDPEAVQIGGGPPKVAPGIFGGSTFASASSLDEEFPELPEVDEPGAAAPEFDEVDQATAILGVEEATESESAQPDILEEESESEPVASEPTSIEHLPAIQAGTGFTRLLGELGNEGLAPFDPARTAASAGTEKAEASGGDHPAFPSLADGWDDIDDELASATPGSDGNDELLDIDDLGLEPFALDDDEMDFVTSVKPASNVSASPKSPFGAISEGIDEVPADAPVQAAQDEDEIQGLTPFAVEDFDEVDGPDSFEFNVLPWEQQDRETELDVQELLAEVADSDDDDDSESVSLDPELPDGVDDYLEITQELSNELLDPQFAQRMAEIEQAARQNLDKLNHDQGRSPAEAVAAADVGADTPKRDEPYTSTPMPTVELLAQDADLFRRARSARSELIDQGAIKGDREFASIIEPDLESVAEATLPASEPEIAEIPHPEPVPVVTEPEAILPVDEHQGDIDELRVAVEANPDDDNARWHYAEALREQGQIHASFSEYRWLIRHAPARHNSIIAALEWCALEDKEADLAHRLLADIYRRRGDSAQARNHATMAMATRRLMREIRM